MTKTVKLLKMDRGTDSYPAALFRVAWRAEAATHKHGAGRWVGLDLAVGQGAPGEGEVRGLSPAQPIPCCAAQVAVRSQGLT